tara:strand:+ start:193 stop:1239 length:1047 start_codon:yes stop_codon:yes gene_type:complete
MRTFADFSNQLMALKETLKKEDIANVAGDGAVSMPPTAKKVKKKRQSKTFNVSPQLFDIFRRGKKKFEKWSRYLNMEDEGHRALYSWAVKNREGIIVLQNSVTGEVRAIRHNRMGGGQWHKISRGITEAEDLPKKVLDDAEEFVKDLKPKKAEFVKKYGAKAKSVMYATAMNMAKKKHGIGEEKKYGNIINQIKDSIGNIGTHKTIEEKANEFLYNGPFSDHNENVEILKNIIKEKQIQKITFDKGGKMKVDVSTAEAVMQFYGKLKETQQQMMRKMMNGNVQGFKTLKNAIGSFIPVDQHKPIASIGNMKSPYPTKAYAMNATAKGPGLGTFKPMNIIARKKNVRSK